MPIELNKPRVLPFSINSHDYALTVKPIPREAWLKYFDSVVIEDRLEDGKITSYREVSAQRVDLLTAHLIDARGYGDAPLPDGWPAMVPLAHRQAAADLLFEVGPGTDIFNGPALLGSERVTLAAMWTESESGQGVLCFDGLAHFFKVPTTEQQRRYSRDSSRSVVQAGRKGATRYLGAQRTLVDLYDELVSSVEGYTVDGEPLSNRRDLITAHMDTYHKAQAMGLIFQPADPRIHEPEAAQ